MDRATECPPRCDADGLPPPARELKSGYVEADNEGLRVSPEVPTHLDVNESLDCVV